MIRAGDGAGQFGVNPNPEWPNFVRTLRMSPAMVCGDRTPTLVFDGGIERREAIRFGSLLVG
jgi:hypothetical protein